jgi:hypothetical protein
VTALRNADEAAAMLGIPRVTLDAMIQRRAARAIVIGGARTVFLHSDEVERLGPQVAP